MPNIRRVTAVKHIQERTGMYWLTDANGIPHKSLWPFLLEEFALEFATAQHCGNVSRIDICRTAGGQSISIECDGRAWTNNLRGICNGKYMRSGPWFAYTIANALSEKMSLEVFDGSEWNVATFKNGQCECAGSYLPNLLPRSEGKVVRVSFTPSRQYCPEEALVEVWSEEALQGIGENLACLHPGLCVCVNGRRHLHPGGTQDWVEEAARALGGRTIMPATTVRGRRASVSCAIVRREDSHRRIVGKVLMDGREVRCRGILAKTMRMIHDCMADSGEAPDGCDCIFLVAYENQEMPLSLCEERVFWFKRDFEANERDPLVEDYCLMVGQCLFGVFGRFMK
ncbi:MAG: hypothetical protein IJS15_10090 [Victivallales bacterium]|nr:hypothetical protein [Victivallales bacterium]